MKIKNKNEKEIKKYNIFSKYISRLHTRCMTRDIEQIYYAISMTYNTRHLQRTPRMTQAPSAPASITTVWPPPSAAATPLLWSCILQNFIQCISQKIDPMYLASFYPKYVAKNIQCILQTLIQLIVILMSLMYFFKFYLYFLCVYLTSSKWLDRLNLRAKN